MRDRPRDLDEERLSRALRAWGVEAATLVHAPVGFGDHHWTATGTDGRRWFVTVADVPHKSHCGPDPWRGLRDAMETAVTLRHERGLDFVVAPVRTLDGQTLLRLGTRYAVSVFPHVAAPSGDFGQRLAGGEREEVLSLLARLHRVAPPPTTPALPLDPAGRAHLERALGELGVVWYGGPYAEPARQLMARHEKVLRERLAELDRRAAGLGGREHVVTHGEPHPGNLLRHRDGLRLVDWDTVGLAVPERDLWHVAARPDELARYAELTGREPDPAALAFYRLRWALDDLGAFVAGFRAPHGRTADTGQAWRGFAGTLAGLDSSPGGGGVHTRARS
ncbi:phosphotransferase [Thermoactinospora rubra]|uniref:phosphotransferase n=1 Tax=Thermoactinospora rubra TaxID=1088767 RepID=UPI000A10978C|nr:phosphotransferase [Thermoactinospora rubra]